MLSKEYIKDITDFIKNNNPTKEKLTSFKVKLSKKYSLNKIPNDIEILLNIKEKDIVTLKKCLLTKETRTISGVAVCAIMTKPISCPHAKKGGPCTYCPGGPKSNFGDVPQSYTGKEPASRRAIRNLYDPYLQVMNRLEQYIVQGHTIDKIELIIMGGTFPSFEKKYQDDFITYSFKAMNDFSKLFFVKNKFNFSKFKDFFELPVENLDDKKRIKRIFSKLLKLKQRKTTLNKEQKLNENSNIKCVAMCIETRPDYGKLKHGNEMLRQGCTRVELGIQTIYDKVLEKISRGHSLKDSIDSTRILKDLGFKINYHVMPGLPSVTKKQDLDSLKKLFSDSNFRPDMLKIYPCMVMKGTALYLDWKKGKFSPLTTKKAASLIAEFKKYVPEYVRIARIQRDIPTFVTEAGVDRTNLRQYIEKLLKKKGIKCKCIRCREIGRTKETVENYEIKIIEYKASKGYEFFIAAEKNDSLIGFCRLRFPSMQLRKEITKKSSLIRELHVFGEATSIGKKGKTQHMGIGKELLKTAEKIAKKNKFNKMVVISGVGVRNYYSNQGYKKEGPYMVRKL